MGVNTPDEVGPAFGFPHSFWGGGKGGWDEVAPERRMAIFGEQVRSLAASKDWKRAAWAHGPGYFDDEDRAITFANFAGFGDIPENKF